MRSEFSEFTYGFSIVHELSELLGCGVAPVFPSLKQEGKAGGGYDVQMDLGAVPFYLQFKLSEHLKTNNAKEAKTSGGALIAPYRRFPITSSITSKQHEMLVALNAQHAHVYYCAPNYVTNRDLNRHWQTGQSAARSVYVRPDDIGPITDGEKHTVCFNNGTLHSDTCLMFSEPKKMRVHTLATLRDDIQRSLEDATTPLKDLLPKWISGLNEARDQAQNFHMQRVEAIHKLLAEQRAKRQSDHIIDEQAVSYNKELVDFRQDDIDVRVEGSPPLIDLSFLEAIDRPDENADNLRAFGQRVSSEFGVQAFVLQRQNPATS